MITLLTFWHLLLKGLCVRIREAFLINSPNKQGAADHQEVRVPSPFIRDTLFGSSSPLALSVGLSFGANIRLGWMHVLALGLQPHVELMLVLQCWLYFSVSEVAVRTDWTPQWLSVRPSWLTEVDISETKCFDYHYFDYFFTFFLNGGGGGPLLYIIFLYSEYRQWEKGVMGQVNLWHQVRLRTSRTHCS